MAFDDVSLRTCAGGGGLGFGEGTAPSGVPPSPELQALTEPSQTQVDETPQCEGAAPCPAGKASSNAAQYPWAPMTEAEEAMASEFAAQLAWLILQHQGHVQVTETLSAWVAIPSRPGVEALAGE